MDQYRKTPRARFINYDSGVFFITICTQDKEHYFGEIKNSEMNLSPIGDFLDKQLQRSYEFCPNILVLSHVVMPNHVHFIISIDAKHTYDTEDYRGPNPALRADASSKRHITSLTKYVSSLKGAVTKYAKSLGLEFGWQPRYYDHLIRGDAEAPRILQYIETNVAHWSADCHYSE